MKIHMKIVRFGDRAVVTLDLEGESSAALAAGVKSLLDAAFFAADGAVDVDASERGETGR